MVKITAIPDAWTEFCLVSVLPDGGSEYQFASLTEDITAMDWGEKDIEGVPTLSGGRIVKKTPMTDESITFKVYPVKADLSGGVVQLFHPQDTADSSQPIVVENDKDRKVHRLILLWAHALPTNASQLPVAGPTYRIQAINAYMTKYTPSFDGKILTAEVTFKWTPFNSSGTANKREESSDDTTALAAATTSATSWA